VEIGQLQALRAIFGDLELKEDFQPNNNDEINQILNSDNIYESNSIVTIQDENIIGLNLGNTLSGGNIDNKICDLNYLEVLDISNNNLSGDKNNYGQLPECINTLNSLRIFKINNNKFRGKMPNLNSTLLEECDIRKLNLCIFENDRIPKICLDQDYGDNTINYKTFKGFFPHQPPEEGESNKEVVLGLCTSTFVTEHTKLVKETSNMDWKVIISSSIFPLSSLIITSVITLLGRMKSKFNKKQHNIMATFTASIAHLPNNFENENNRQSLLVPSRYDPFKHPAPRTENVTLDSSDERRISSDQGNTSESSNNNPSNPVISSNYQTIGNNNNNNRYSLTSAQGVRFKNAFSSTQNKRFSLNSSPEKENIMIPVTAQQLSINNALPVIHESESESESENENEIESEKKIENVRDINDKEKETMKIENELEKGKEKEINIKDENKDVNENKYVNENKNVNENVNKNRNEKINENLVRKSSGRSEGGKSAASSTTSKARESLNMLLNSPEAIYYRSVSPTLSKQGMPTLSKQGIVLDNKSTTPTVFPNSYSSMSPTNKDSIEKGKSPAGVNNIGRSHSLQNKMQSPIIHYEKKPRVRRVVYSFIANLQDELSLTPGQEVVIHEVFDDGYAYGENISNGKLGVFPITSLHPSDQDLSPGELDSPSINDVQISQLSSPNMKSPLSNVISSSQFNNINIQDITPTITVNKNNRSSDIVEKMNYHNIYSTYNQNENNIDALRLQANSGYSAYINQLQQQQIMMKMQAEQAKRQEMMTNRNKYDRREYYQEQPFSTTYMSNGMILNENNNNQMYQRNSLQRPQKSQNQFAINDIGSSSSSTVCYPSRYGKMTNMANAENYTALEMQRMEEHRYKQIRLIYEKLNQKDLGPEERKHYLQYLQKYFQGIQILLYQK